MRYLYENIKIDSMVFEFAVRFAHLTQTEGGVSKADVDKFLDQKDNKKFIAYVGEEELESARASATSFPDKKDGADHTWGSLIGGRLAEGFVGAKKTEQKSSVVRDTRCVYLNKATRSGKLDYAFIQQFSEHLAGWQRVGCLPLGSGYRQDGDGTKCKCVWVLAADPASKEKENRNKPVWRLEIAESVVDGETTDLLGGERSALSPVSERLRRYVSSDGALPPDVVSNVTVWLGDETLKGCDLVFLYESRAVVDIGLEEFYVKEKLSREEKKQAQRNGFEGDSGEGAVTFIDAKPVPEIDKVAVERAQSWLRNAINRDATDIHIEPIDGGGRVRLRIDGSLVEVESLVRPFLLRQICTWLKVQADVDITEMRRPLDGKLMLARMVDGKRYDVDVRFSSIPTIYGEKVVLRLLDKSKQDERYEKKGGLEGLFPPDQAGKQLYARFEDALSFDNGIVLVTGPTGCGKTTTLNASLRYILDHDHNTSNIVTIEDPVEYTLKGANQIQTNDLAGLTFANALRAILRQDPDIVLVGEIRDEETASVAVQSALTGHLILSTLHTNDAIGCVERLSDLKVSPFLIGSTVRLFQAQRLVKLLCPWISEKEPGCSHRLSEEETIQHIKQSRLARYVGRFAGKTIRVANEVGCRICGSQSRGYKGRRAVMEVIPMNPELRSAIQTGCPRDELLKIAKERCQLRSMVEYGLDLLLADANRSVSGGDGKSEVSMTDLSEVSDLELGDN